jgi:hypothetical protein
MKQCLGSSTQGRGPGPTQGLLLPLAAGASRCRYLLLLPCLLPLACGPVAHRLGPWPWPWPLTLTPNPRDGGSSALCSLPLPFLAGLALQRTPIVWPSDFRLPTARALLLLAAATSCCIGCTTRCTHPRGLPCALLPCCPAAPLPSQSSSEVTPIASFQYLGSLPLLSFLHPIHTTKT